MRWGWDAGGDEELATWLNGEPSLKAAAKGLEDVWVCGKESWAHDWTAGGAGPRCGMPCSVRTICWKTEVARSAVVCTQRA